MEPVVLALKEKHSSKMEFVIADVTKPEGSSLAGKFDIYYIPAFFILDPQGQVLHRIEFPEIQDDPEGRLDSIIAADLQKIR